MTAALTGPSTATLIVPKTQIWKAGGTPFYLRGNSSNFWPHYLTADTLEDQPYCFGQEATNYGVCPSGGFHSLWDHFGQHSPFNFKETHPAYSKAMSGSLFNWPVDSPVSQALPVYTLGDARFADNSGAYTFLVQSHAATAIMLQQITTDWWNALLTANKFTTNDVNDRVAQTTVLNPLTQVRCSNPTNMSSSGNNVIFPVLSADGWVWLPGTPTSINTLNATATDHLRFQWVHLPGSFGPSTIGAVFESAWISDNSSRVVLGCTVFSTYVNATLFTDEYSFWSGWYPWNIDFVHRDSGYLPTGGQDPSNKSIGLSVNDTWLNLLTPSTPPDGPGSYSWQPSTIESIMTNSGLQDLTISGNVSSLGESWRLEDLTGSGKSMLLEAIICSIFVDGLSRSRSNKIYNTTGPVLDWTISGYKQRADFNKSVITGKDALNPPKIASGNATKLCIDFNITGYVYEVSLAEYLAMTVLIVHIAFAVSHTVWILHTRETSDSWDSMSGILALAQNSHSSIGVLKNASAAIDSFSTYVRMARIRAIQRPGHADFDHVEIVFLPENATEAINNIELTGHDESHTLKTTFTAPEPSSTSDTILDEQNFTNHDHHSMTWPRNSSNRSDSSTSTLVDSRQPIFREDSMASLSSQHTATSVVKCLIVQKCLV